ncbi:UNKNOWN [Stylonychia lemnae]|uniref:Uncharacterized protein n=1 Tax=Stylonychia lemnae TaxID=5949 RepID=A0A078BAL1_STYLE|nr:UNKNOWN [Stylonychia lemnae]|eukprot:CDW91266.1 UNKNOWN [Stylonychia lemnae]
MENIEAQNKTKRQKLVNIKPKKSIRHLIAHRFKSLDQFGRKVLLTFEGEESYKTSFGALISLFLIITLLCYAAFKGINLYNKYNPNISRVSLIRDMSDGLLVKPQNTGFDFAIGLRKDLHPSIGFITIKQAGYYITDQLDQYGNPKRPKLTYPLKFHKCGTEYFNYPNQSEVVEKGISNYLCLDKDDYKFQGNFYQKNFQYLEIKLWKCQNQSSIANRTDVPNSDGTYDYNYSGECQDQQVIDDYFNQEVFSLAFINTYFDFFNFREQNPIRKFIDDQFFLELESSKIKKANIYFQVQKGNLQDEYIQFGQYEEIEFHQLKNFRQYDKGYTNDEGHIVALYMRLDNEYDLYNRKIYSILELLGDIGGLYRALSAIGIFIVAQIASTLFFSDVMTKIYQVFDNNGELSKQNNNTEEVNYSPSTNLQNVFSGEDTLKSDKEQKKIQKCQRLMLSNLKIEENKRSQNLKDKNSVDSDDIQGLLNSFMTRKLELELDVIHLVKTLRKFKLLAQAQLNQQHRMLLRFQRQNLIETSSESSDSDDNHLEPLGLLESQNPMIKLVTLGKLKKMMKSFEGKSLNSIESNLIRGVFKRKLKDFQDELKKITLIQRVFSTTCAQSLEQDSNYNLERDEEDYIPEQRNIYESDEN